MGYRIGCSCEVNYRVVTGASRYSEAELKIRMARMHGVEVSGTSGAQHSKVLVLKDDDAVVDRPKWSWQCTEASTCTFETSLADSFLLK